MGGGTKTGFDAGKEESKSCSKQAPKWRHIGPGINLDAYCKNKECEAFNQLVCVIMKGITSFDFISSENSNLVVCPMCKNEVTPINCTLFKCKYEFKGLRYEGQDQDELVEKNWSGETVGDQYTCFKRVNNDNNINDDKWLELVVTVTLK